MGEAILVISVVAASLVAAVVLPLAWLKWVTLPNMRRDLQCELRHWTPSLVAARVESWVRKRRGRLLSFNEGVMLLEFAMWLVDVEVEFEVNIIPRQPAIH